jgi:hypothetical protein
MGEYLLGRFFWWIIGLGLIGWGAYEIYQGSLAPEGPEEISLRDLLTGARKSKDNPFVLLKDFAVCEDRVVRWNHATGEAWDGWIPAVPAGERGAGCGGKEPVRAMIRATVKDQGELSSRCAQPRLPAEVRRLVDSEEAFLSRHSAGQDYSHCLVLEVAKGPKRAWECLLMIGIGCLILAFLVFRLFMDRKPG